MAVRMGRFVAVLAMTWFLTNSLALSQTRNPKRIELADEPSVTYQPPEEFPPGRWDEFQKQAEQLWTTYPNHPYAPRAMFDWVLVAKTRQGPPDDINRVQFELLIQYPASIYARHVVANSNPQELRTRMSAQFEQQAELSEQYLSQFGRLVLQGFSVHGPSWITIDDFGVQSLVSARVAKLGGLTGLLESKFEAAPAETKKILAVGLDASVPAVDRYVRLSEFGKAKSARVIQRALWTQLSEDEQQQPRVDAALAEQRLQEGRWDLALPIAERLRKHEPNNSRWLLWTGCCLVAAGQDAEGLRCLKQVVKLDAKSDEGAVAARLIPVIGSMTQSEADSAAVLDELTNRVVKEAPQVLSLEASFLAKDGEPIRMQIQFEGPRFRMVCWKGKRPRAGFQSGPESCKFFTDDEATVLELMGRQYQPAVMIQFMESPAGLAKHMTSNLVTAPPDLRTTVKSFLESPALANGGWQTLLRRRRTVGTFVTPVEVAGGGRTLRWLNVDLLQLKVTETLCRLSDTSDLKDLDFEETHVDKVRWGKLDEVELPKLDWPKYPERRVATDDVAGLMRLMSLMTKLFSFEEPSATAQTEGASSKR